MYLYVFVCMYVHENIVVNPYQRLYNTHVKPMRSKSALICSIGKGIGLNSLFIQPLSTSTSTLPPTDCFRRLRMCSGNIVDFVCSYIWLVIQGCAFGS